MDNQSDAGLERLRPLQTMRVLLIGHDSSDGRAVREALAGGRDGSFIVECAPRLVEGLERLRENGIDAILLDLCLPDSRGIEAFEQVWQAAPHVPILVITSPDDEGAATQAVTRGAQDFLRRDRLDSYTLPRALKRIIERKAAEEALFFEQQRADVTLTSIGDAVLSTDLQSNVTYLNPVAERMTGWRRQEALGRPLSEVFQIIDATSRKPARNPIAQAMDLDKTVGLTPNCLLIRRDGPETAIDDSASPIHDRGGHVIGAVIVFRDVSAARAMSLQAVYLAQHDFLTGLPNRMLLNDRLTQAIALAGRHGQRLAVLFLDLDRFKHVNDSLGHGMGDTLLQSVARRLAASVRGSDTVSRQGGDEFVVLLSEIAQADDAAACAQKIIAALVAPHEVAHHQLHVTATIGISIYPDDGPDAETLIKCADTAMYHAKDRGRNNYQFFERDMNARAVERQWIEAGLHRALARHEFVLHYQPKIDLDTGAMTGAEALIRWVHPERGLMLPGDFVPVAEDCGLIVPIGQWVLREACRQARAWIDEGRRPMAVAVNISAVEFRDPRFLDNLRTILGDSRLEARYLELELTESSLIQQGESTVLAIQALKDLGVQVALDDFGTGYSSLSYLRQFPIDVLKVDRAFVHEISADPAGTSIVCAVISMGKSLGHRVIAEGVETVEQLAFLQAQQCSEGQGYFFSRPMAADEFVGLLDTRPAGTGPPGLGHTGRAADAPDVMMNELGPPAVGARALGLRGDQERRRMERRATVRGTRDRRQSVRRRANVRSLIFTAMVLSAPQQLKHSPLTFSHAPRAPEVLLPPSVDVAIAIPLSQAYDGLIHEAAALYGVSPTLIRSVMQAESAFDPAAISRAGAMGLMQLMPDVARAFGIADPFDPRQNIMGGTRLLAELLESQHNNIPLVLAAYNAGPTAVARYGGVPPFRETRDYVRKITDLIADARSAGND